MTTPPMAEFPKIPLSPIHVWTSLESSVVGLRADLRVLRAVERAWGRARGPAWSFGVVAACLLGSGAGCGYSWAVRPPASSLCFDHVYLLSPPVVLGDPVGLKQGLEQILFASGHACAPGVDSRRLTVQFLEIDAPSFLMHNENASAGSTSEASSGQSLVSVGGVQRLKVRVCFEDSSASVRCLPELVEGMAELESPSQPGLAGMAARGQREATLRALASQLFRHALEQLDVAF